MNRQHGVPPQQPRAVYSHEHPGQIMYAIPPARVSGNLPDTLYVDAPPMRPSSTMVDENGEPVHFYPAMSARPSFAPQYGGPATHPSFHPQSRASQGFSGEANYALDNGQYTANDQFRHAPQHLGIEGFAQPTRGQGYATAAAAQGRTAPEMPAPVPPAPHLWSNMIPQAPRQQVEEGRTTVPMSPAAPGTISPTLQRLLRLQQTDLRRSSVSQELPSSENLLAEAEAFFTAMETTEQQLVDALESAHTTVESTHSDLEGQSGDGKRASPAKRPDETSGAEARGGVTTMSASTSSVGAGAALEDGADSKSTCSSGANSQDRVKQDLAFCERLVGTLENANAALRTLDVTNRRIQQYFLVDKYHGNKQSFFQRLHRRVEASTGTNGSLGAPRSSMNAREAEEQAREDAVCDRLLADILMQRHFVPPTGESQQDENDDNQARFSTPHTQLRIVRFPMSTHTDLLSSSNAPDEELPLLLITVPSRAVAAFEATKAAESSIPSSVVSPQTDVAALTTPARYTQMQLLEVTGERLETMRRRVGALEQRRATELHDVESRLRELDAYDPSTDELHARRERIRRELGLFQGWLDHMATLKAHLLAAEQEIFQSVLEAREIRRQLLLVLEQRLQEDGSHGDDEETSHRRDGTERSEQVRFSHASRESTTDDLARRSTQPPHLPRASTVFLAMLQRISDEQKETQLPSDPQLSNSIEPPPETLPAPSATTVTASPPSDALRVTAPPSKESEEEATVAAPTDPVAVPEANGTDEVTRRAGRRRGRDEMEADAPMPAHTGKPETARAQSHRSSSVVSVSPPSGNEEEEDAYEDPLPFASAGADDTKELDQEEYSLRSGKLFRGVTAFVKSVVKRAITFSDDDDDSDEDGSGTEGRPVKRHRTE